MRDISTVPRGEHVTVRTGFAPVMDGEYVGVVDGRIVIDLGREIAHVPLDTIAFTVEDDTGEPLGVVTDDPVLVSITPELE